MPRTHGPAHPLHLHVVPDGGWVSHILGVPVAIRGSVLVLTVLVGWLTDHDLDRAPFWALFGPLTLLVVEAAHGAAARAAGLAPTVELSWTGGLTRWHRPGTASRARSLLVLTTAPVTAVLVALGARAARSIVLTGGRDDALTDVALDALDVTTTVAVALALLDLLPVLHRSAGRALHVVLPGLPIRRTLRVASLGAVVCAVAVVVLAAGPRPWLAALPGFHLLTNGWIALRGERTIGRSLDEAMAHDDWRTVRRRVLAGCDTPRAVVDAQRTFLERGQLEGAAEIGDAALTRWPLVTFAVRSARARVLLEQPDLALARVRDAVRHGADPDELATEPLFRTLTTSERWPRSVADLDATVDLGARTGAMDFSADR